MPSTTLPVFNLGRQRATEGFSFAELITIIAIIGILATIALPVYFSSLPKRRLKTAGRELYAIMQQVRLRAVKENQRKRLRFESNFYYLDGNNNKKWNAGEKRIDLSRYHDIQFGAGAARKNWNRDPISQAVFITFSPTGTANSRTVYLQNITEPSECFAATSQTSGSIKIRWFDGKTWR